MVIIPNPRLESKAGGSSTHRLSSTDETASTTIGNGPRAHAELGKGIKESAIDYARIEKTILNREIPKTFTYIVCTDSRAEPLYPRSPTLVL